jgi:hypothetical protein
MGQQKTSRYLLVLVPLYVPVALAGTWLSLRFDVGHATGSDPSADLLARGTALSPPLVLVGLVLAGTLLAQPRGAVGAAGRILAGLGGCALFLVGAVGLPVHLEVARSVGAPESTTVVLGVLTALFGLAFSAVAFGMLGRSVQRRRSEVALARRPARA